MRPDVVILGQGLAGTVLGCELERAGVRFTIVDAGHALAATPVAAGIVNPVTGRRIVPTWRATALVPEARACFRRIGEMLGVTLWHDLRVWRSYADDRERAAAHEKHARGELAPFVDEVGASGFWIRGAARVDVERLVGAARARWSAAGLLSEGRPAPAEASGGPATVIDCRGRFAAEDEAWAWVPWEFSHGEVLGVKVEGLDPEVILNRRKWVAPVAPGFARVGATHEPGRRDGRPSAEGRAELVSHAMELLGAERPFEVAEHRAGVRVHVRDKRPVAGRHPNHPRLGLINALGGKGALWSPLLARLWVEHLVAGTPFDAEVDVARFAPG